ncbi:MAG: LPS assembly lipoprotein LptE [Pseudomonadota bacterium]
MQVGTPDSTNAFTLVRALETRLGVAEEPIYTLALSVDLNEEGSVITRTQDIDRFSIRGEAAYTLATLDGTAVAQESVRAFTSYSAAGTPLSTRAARADAQDRLMEILADQIVTRLAAAVA